MSKNLYFLPLIANALRQPEPKVALRAAIKEIITLGQRPEYKQGFLQFQHFIARVKRNWEKCSPKPEDIELDMVWCLSLQVAVDLLEGDENETQAILDLIGSQPRWQEEFDKISRETSEYERPRIPKIIVERNRKSIASIPCEHLPVTKVIRGLKPGNYTVKLDVGRIIWEEELTERELLWAFAFPGEALDLAADTGEAVERITREVRLLDGNLIIRVFPELESGRLELKIGDLNLG